jgi:hypothetical protein
MKNFLKLNLIILLLALFGFTLASCKEGYETYAFDRMEASPLYQSEIARLNALYAQYGFPEISIETFTGSLTSAAVRLSINKKQTKIIFTGLNEDGGEEEHTINIIKEGNVLHVDVDSNGSLSDDEKNSSLIIEGEELIIVTDLSETMSSMSSVFAVGEYWVHAIFIK